MAGLFALIVAGGLALIWQNVVDGERYRQECQARGGHVLELRRNRLCLTDDGRIIELRR